MSARLTPPPLPHWASNRNVAAEVRKRLVLRFLFNYAALQHGQRTSLRSLADDCGYSETSITTAISNANCSADLAKAVEQTVGRRCFDAHWLTSPEELLK